MAHLMHYEALVYKQCLSMYSFLFGQNSDTEIGNVRLPISTKILSLLAHLLSNGQPVL